VGKARRFEYAQLPGSSEARVSRKLSAFEVKCSLATLARMPADDLDGYVVVLAKDAEVVGVMTNAADEATIIGLLARTIEQRAVAVSKIEDDASQ
jgi:hypothetical protein